MDSNFSFEKIQKPGKVTSKAVVQQSHALPTPVVEITPEVASAQAELDKLNKSMMAGTLGTDGYKQRALLMGILKEVK